MPGAKPPPLQKRRRSSLPKIIIVAAIAVVVIPVILFAVWRWNLSRDIGRLEAKARATGEPITLQELAATRKPVPDEENAAVALMDIWQEEDPAFWKPFRERSPVLPQRSKITASPNIPVFGQRMNRNAFSLPWTTEQVAATSDYLNSTRDRAKRVRSALNRPKCEFPVVYELGAETHLPHLSAIRREVQMCLLAALYYTADGSHTAEVENIATALRLANMLRDEPGILSKLVRVALVDMSPYSIESIISQGSLSNDELDQLNSLLSEVSLENACYTALFGERAVVLSAFDSPVDAQPRTQSSADGPQLPGWFFKGFSLNRQPMNVFGVISLDRRLLLQTYDKIMSKIRDGDWTQLTASIGIIKEGTAAAKGFPPKIFTDLHLQSLDRAVERIIRTEARRRCTITLLQIEKYRLVNRGGTARFSNNGEITIEHI